MNNSKTRRLILVLMSFMFVSAYATIPKCGVRAKGMSSLNDSVKFDKSTFFTQYASELGLAADDKVELQKTIKESDGQEHIRYSHKHKGLKVEFSDFQINKKSNAPTTTIGELKTNIDVNITPKITARQAIGFAMKEVNAKKYAWEESKKSANEKYPIPELVILPKNEVLNTQKDYLVYKIKIHAVDPFDIVVVYVDASNGDIIYKKNCILYGNQTGTAVTLYRGSQSIVSDLNAGVYSLKMRTSTNSEIQTLDWNFHNPVNITDLDNYWSPAKAEYDAHWGAMHAFNYFKNTFNRNSFDDNGMPVISNVHLLNENPYTHVFSPFSNSFFNSEDNMLYYGDGDGVYYRAFTSLDVVGHEFTHGVITHSANIEYANHEGSALHEGFADIFGTCIDFYVDPNKANWLHGEETRFNLKPSRNLSNPREFKQPSKYQGKDWMPQYKDLPDRRFWMDAAQRGHQNCSILTYWFYLLTTGGSGDNEGINYSVDGIGMDAASIIAYRALTIYLFPLAQYRDAREATILAAMDLFGENSNEMLQVAKAWDAVGVNSNTIIQENIQACGVYPDGTRLIARNSIVTGNCPNGYTEILPNTTVSFRAGNSIILNPGFSATIGCKFHARMLKLEEGEMDYAPRIENENIEDLNMPSKAPELSNSCFPNPTHGEFTVRMDLPEHQTSEIRVYDSMGKLVKTMVASATETLISIGDQPAGIYFVRYTVDGKDQSAKVVKL
jgi:Zn-dependent metalloprotease